MGAGLGDEADRPGFARRLLCRLAHAQLRIVEAHAVGPDERQSGLSGDAADLRLELCPFGFARLGKARGEEGDGAHSLRRAIGDDARGDGARYRADSVVDLVGYLRQRGEVGDAQLLDAGDLVRVDLDGVELAREGAHTAQPEVAHGPLIANHGDGTRPEGA